MWLDVTSIAISIVALSISGLTAYYSLWPRPKLTATLVFHAMGDPVTLALHNNGRRGTNIISSLLYWKNEREGAFSYSWLRSLAPHHTIATPLSTEYHGAPEERKGSVDLVVVTGEGKLKVPVTRIVADWSAPRQESTSSRV